MKVSKRVLSGMNVNMFANTAVLRFECNFNTIYGEQLYIVGSTEELGNWDMFKSIPMETNQCTYPIWKSTISLTCPIGTTIEYKYLIYDGHQYIWELLPNPIEPRKVTVPNGGEYIVLNKQGDNSSQLQCSIKQKVQFNNNKSILDLLSYENNKRTCDVINDSDDFFQSQKLESADRIILASTLLPVSVIKKDNGEYELRRITTNTVTAKLTQLKEQKGANVQWVGILADFDKYSEDELNDIDTFLQSNGYYMVFITPKEYEDYYIYIHKILFPVFSESLFDQKNEHLFQNEDYFNVFHSVNILFANEIADIMLENDLIIVNDLALALVPNSLVQKNYNASIGIYIDYMIPSSDIVKIYPKYQEIIKSILLCDVIGFHFFISARNLIAVLERFFGIYHTISAKGLVTISYLGRTIILHISHAAIDVDFINEIKEEKAFKTYDEYYRNLIGDRYAIMAMDHDYFFLSIAIKLRAVVLLLGKYKEMRGKVVFFLCLKHLHGTEMILLPNINKMIEEIRTKYGNETIVIEQYTRFEINKRLAMMNNCKVLLYPFYYQGHCVFANEFLSMQNAEKNYHILLGENTCATANIKSVIRINPFNSSLIMKTLKNCYDSSFNKQKFKTDYSYLSQHSTLNWITSFILDLKRVKYHDSLNKFGLGLGLEFRLVKLNCQFSHMDKHMFLSKYRRSTKRLFFFSYENTLQEIDETEIIVNKPKTLFSDDEDEEESLSPYIPSRRLHTILKDLALDKNNLIFVVSKQRMNDMEEWFKFIPSIGLGAECGFFYRYPYNDSIHQLLSLSEMSWKETVMRILKGFTDKTEGSFIEKKKASISWIYRNCDSYFGHIQANEIKMHLDNIFENKLEILNSEGCLIIKPKDINKGYFISNILQKEIQKENNSIDFIYAVGADVTDESMFKYLHSAEKYFTYFNPNVKLLTATIGKHPSSAQWYYNEINDLIESLECLSLNNRKKASVRNTVSYSATGYRPIRLDKQFSMKMDHFTFSNEEEDDKKDC